MYYMTFRSDVLDRVRAEADAFYGSMKVDGSGVNVDMDEISRLLPYTEAALKETIRLSSPAASITHALEDNHESFTFSNGLEIRAGDDACVYIDGILRNPDYFEDPWTYNPDRWLDPNEEKRLRCEANLMAFDYGPRVCPGMRLAMVEGTLALAALVRHVEFKLGCDYREVKRIMLFTSGPDKVPMIISPRKLP